MKTTMTTFKASLSGLLLMISSGIFAQTAPTPTLPVTTANDLNIGTLDDGQPPVTHVADGVLFYNPETNGPSLTLVATVTDLVTGLDFSSYIWYEITLADGNEVTAVVQESESNQLALSDLEPGYHRYRVYGLVDDDGVICQSDEFQDIILFVLRPLAVTASEIDAITAFCLNDVPTEPLALEAEVDFNSTVAYNSNGFPTPGAADFDLTYRWYAINNAAPGTEISLTDPLTNTNAGAENNITVDYADFTAAGTYTFHVEVEYSSSIQDRGDRDHAIWTATVGGETPFELVVTTAPGRPTITIESVND